MARALLALLAPLLLATGPLLAVARAADPEPAQGQEQLEDVFGGLGSAKAQEGTQAGQQAGTGTIEGRVFDAETGKPVPGATVIVIWPPPQQGGTPPQQVQTSAADGSFTFSGIPAGRYRMTFVRSGYRPSTMTDFEVQAGESNRADFPLPPVAAKASGEVLQLEEFVVEASTVNEMMASLELRMESDQLLNIMSSEELSRFAAGDVAEALKRVAGVNVVEGQFAIIRGLEDRYSSTLYNGAVVPSPDPDKQSVQLDLFPSDVVGNLVVSKTFAPDLPSNSAGGSIDIVTNEYPSKFQFKIGLGAGFNERARHSFLKLNDRNPVGTELGPGDVTEGDYSLTLGGRTTFAKRELRYKMVLANETDYQTAQGYQESLEPKLSQFRRIPRPGRYVASGGLALGRLDLTAGRFDLTTSERSEQNTGYWGLGFNLDQEGNHKIDASMFVTRKNQETVQLKDNGFLPGYDYGKLAAKQLAGQAIDFNDYDDFATLSSWISRGVRAFPADPLSRGALWFTNFLESKSFDRTRKLEIYQVNGDHRFSFLDGFHLSWAVNEAKTSQDDVAYGVRAFFEPDDSTAFPTTFPSTVDQLGSGRWVANNGVFYTLNDVSEHQYFARVDGEYERDLIEHFKVKLSAGYWYETSKRNVAADFLETPTVKGRTQFAIVDDNLLDLGDKLLDSLNSDPSGKNVAAGVRNATNQSSREIEAWHLDFKATVFDRLDLLAGFRREKILIRSINDPFTGQTILDGSQGIFPTKYLFFDRLDDPGKMEVGAFPVNPGTYNDQLLGVQVAQTPCVADPTRLCVNYDDQTIASIINGTIDARRNLPSYGFALRPLEGMTLRGAISETVARPSFRELGYYVSVEAGTDDLVVGNPQLQLSDVKSRDLRLEYAWGDHGDLAAASYFTKEIKKPIESLVVRDPLNLEGSSSALYRTFFNNPNTAHLEGYELEARKNLGFLSFGWRPLDFLEYFSIGGNYTGINAKVKRTQVELDRASAYFGVAAGDTLRFMGLSSTRRLFGQPEWIANADVTFDNPDWGTKLTLAYFAISNVLDAAGSAGLLPNGNVRTLTLDRYIDQYEQLDLIVSQTLHFDFLPGDFTLKGSVKNLTDSRRQVIYDPNQTIDEFQERSFRVGRDYSFSLSWGVSF